MQGWNDVETATQSRNRRSAVNNKLKKVAPGGNISESPIWGKGTFGEPSVQRRSQSQS
jgi:hypothetical protein